MSEKPTQLGFSLIEALVALAISSITATALGLSTGVGYKLCREAHQRAIAGRLVVSGIEQLNVSDPALLQSTDKTESIEVSGSSFFRTTQVTVNVDGSRFVEVSVELIGMPEANKLSRSASATLVPWRQ